MDADVSGESTTSTEDFEFIQPIEPRLMIAGNGSQEGLKQSLNEVLMDSAENIKKENAMTAVSEDAESGCDREGIDDIVFRVLENKCRAESVDGSINSVSNSESTHQDADTICVGSRRQMSLPMVLPEVSNTTVQHVTYLGAATINAPRSEVEIQRNMAILNEQLSEHTMEVMLLVPSSSEGSVVLNELNSSTEIASFKIHRILFCARGRQDSSEVSCFAFTCSHGSSAETAIFQCHVFRCSEPETVGVILHSFASAFRRIPTSPTKSESSIRLEEGVNDIVHSFDITLEIKEEDSKGNFNSCPKDKTFFKLRCNFTRKVLVTVQQISGGPEICIQRCFGILVSPGRNVKHSDMQLLELDSMTVQQAERKIYTITGMWDPKDPNFEVLNHETPKDAKIFFSVAVDLVVEGIHEPVRFVIETKAKIYPQSERFWYFAKKSLTEVFYLTLRETDSVPSDEVKYEVVSIKSAGEIERKKPGLGLNLRTPLLSALAALQGNSAPGDNDDDSDSDEPLLSGSGDVSKDCTEGELEGWADVLAKWRQNLSQRPRQLNTLVRKGIPEALRGEVWQLLSNCHADTEMMDTYRLLITKESTCEGVILRDINRTFPAHDFFREAGGIGQDALYKISKAYSVYDEEVGYCQGLSFLAAALLLHMPEEQAFCVLVRVMFGYELRDLFKDNFEVLHLRFFQLERLMEDQIPDLAAHFRDLGIEAHMFGSQWFLTLFTAKFPLFLVFHILDLFLCEGNDTIFQVALGLLLMSKKELLTLDFEGALKYFRVSLPKKYRSEENARQLLRIAVAVKVKKLKKYEKEYITLKEQERQQEDPAERFQRENRQLLRANMRLEQENDDLAHELVTSKIQLRNELDVVEDKAESLNKELLRTRTQLLDTEEEKRRLETESIQVKEMCRRELLLSEAEITRNAAIISEYKQICNQLSSRLDQEQTLRIESLAALHAQVKGCERCTQALAARRAEGGTGGVVALVDGDRPLDDGQDLEDAQRQVRELELELAQTKLALVEAECRNQDLTHQLNSAIAEVQASRNTWFHKTLTSIREVTKKEPSTPTGPGQAHLSLGNPQSNISVNVRQNESKETTC